jgi:hypothetical protein
VKSGREIRSHTRTGSERENLFWRRHILLAYAVVGAAYAVIYVVARLVSRETPNGLAALGASPSVISLIAGTLSGAVGAWGVLRVRINAAWTFLFVLSFVGGILTLAKAFGLP